MYVRSKLSCLHVYVFAYLFLVVFNCLFFFPITTEIGTWDTKDNDIVVVHGRNLRAKSISDSISENIINMYLSIFNIFHI